MTGDRCVHEMLPGQCGLCTPRRRPVQAARMAPVTAEYAGQCAAECGRRIRPGDPIIRDEAGDGWLHEECA